VLLIGIVLGAAAVSVYLLLQVANLFAQGT
jgi:hypothetical protein